MNAVGRKIKFYREKQGLTQVELAEAMGYKDHSTIGRIERGENDIVASTISKFASIFNVSPADLFDFSESDSDSHIIHNYGNIPMQEYTDAIANLYQQVKQAPALEYKIKALRDLLNLPQIQEGEKKAEVKIG